MEYGTVELRPDGSVSGYLELLGPVAILGPERATEKRCDLEWIEEAHKWLGC